MCHHWDLSLLQKRFSRKVAARLLCRRDFCDKRESVESWRCKCRQVQGRGVNDLAQLQSYHVRVYVPGPVINLILDHALFVDCDWTCVSAGRIDNCVDLCLCVSNFATKQVRGISIIYHVSVIFQCHYILGTVKPFVMLAQPETISGHIWNQYEIIKSYIQFPFTKFELAFTFRLGKWNKTKPHYVFVHTYILHMQGCIIPL